MTWAEERFSEGLGYRQVVTGLEVEFKISTRSAERVISEVYSRWRTAGEEDRPVRLARMRRALWRMVRRADEAGEFGAAMRGLAQLCKVDGLEAPTKIEAHVDARPAFQDPLSLTPLQREKRIAELLAERSQRKKGRRGN